MDGSTASSADGLKARGRGLIREAALIAGRWVQGEGVIEVEDPAEEVVLGAVP
jgi:hypothetical protein